MRKGLALFLVAASAAVTMSLPAAAMEPLQSAELTARIGDGRFEFRARTMLWRFTPDGKVTNDYTTSRTGGMGGAGETFGLKDSGTWRRDGDRLCVTWQSRRGAENCYTVAHGEGRMVRLMGPPMKIHETMSVGIEGTLESLGETPALATTPSAPKSFYQQYNYRYQRIPGGR